MLACHRTVTIEPYHAFMKIPAHVHPREDGSRKVRFHRWRRVKDLLARRLIALGGISVIIAVVLILFYLLYVVAPLFLTAQAETHQLGKHKNWAEGNAVYMAIEEQQKVGLRVDESGMAEFFEVDGLENISSRALLTPGNRVMASAEANQGNGVFVLVTDHNQALLVRHSYTTSYAEGVENRKIVPLLDFPYGKQLRPLTTHANPGDKPGDQPVDKAGDKLIRAVALSDEESALVLAVATDSGISVDWNTKQANFLTGDVNLSSRQIEQDVDFDVTALAISSNHRWLYAADQQGNIHHYQLPELQEVQSIKVSSSPITSMKMLLGGISVLAGDASGLITQLFPVKDSNNQYELKIIRRFEGQSAAITQLLPEYRRKGFLALDADGQLGIYHSTAGQMVLKRQLAKGTPVTGAVSPRANGLLTQYPDGSASLLSIDNQHPEVSLASLWQKVWYENYPEPQYVWQSSAATNEFEPKFSLTPLAFGTFKAAIFAMLFAVPFALMGAAYTAYFMAPELRELVKPTIEIMAALPTVILGFLAGLWFAPFLEENLASLVTISLLMPVGLLLFAYGWSHYQGAVKAWVKEGWEPVLLIPVILILLTLSLELADPMQQTLFDGDLRVWMRQALGISYDQRNALVVGFAMGFAVIPTVFSMAEDAIFGVPHSLSDGSLALGATPWQTLVRVIIPTASPGIFSALMIGLGRAVGETMIVLMATGNTPVMDWSVFEGMRTLAANIAVEIPESEVDSSHYRILFLAALVLFIFTFVVNTGAEIIRQRLRERYSSL